MRPTSEDYARVDAIEAKLAELDPIIEKFCARNGFRFNKRGEMRMWPRRGMWVREEIDRSIYLTMDLTVAEAMDRGFYPEMPWSLGVAASLPMETEPSARILSTLVFQSVPYCQLAAVLEKGLEEGLAVLRSQTAQDIMAKGQLIG